MGDLSKHFSRNEFRCPGRFCCGHSGPSDSKLIDALEELRELADKPIHIIKGGGFRCERYNRRGKGRAPKSQHLYGRAADIVIEGMTPQEVATLANNIPAFANGGIGVYDRFTHVDVRGTRARWTNL